VGDTRVLGENEVKLGFSIFAWVNKRLRPSLLGILRAFMARILPPQQTARERCCDEARAGSEVMFDVIRGPLSGGQYILHSTGPSALRVTGEDLGQE
jgi:hypothetical protein